MNRTPDVELVLRQWLADDGDVAPDRILEVVADRIALQPRRPIWRLQGRSFVNTYTKLAAAAAAVLVVGVVGWQLLPRNGGAGAAAPTASPTTPPLPVASPSPSVAASASAVFPKWYTAQSDGGSGILPAGSATTRSFLPGSTFVVPANWVNDTDSTEFFGLFPDTPANEAQFALSAAPAQAIFVGIVDTPSGLVCDGVDTSGSTAAALAASLVANKALVTSRPVEVTIGALTGTRVDSYLSHDSTMSCSKDYRARFVFLDLPDGGKLLIIAESVRAADFEPFLAEAMPIIESFDFNVAP